MYPLYDRFNNNKVFVGQCIQQRIHAPPHRAFHVIPIFEYVPVKRNVKHFGKLKKLKPGDEMSYTTKLGTRTYVVDSVSKISDTDWSKLQYTSDNRLTLITCVEDVGSQRLCVQAVEKR